MTKTKSKTLAERESRAQRGIIEFAVELQAIRDERLYPNATRPTPGEGHTTQAWEAYCRDRWGLSASAVDQTIRAVPVVSRRTDAGESPGSMRKATTVATLPVKVQDAILTKDPSKVREQDVVAKAKAAREERKRAELANVSEAESIKRQIAAARKAKAKAPADKPKREDDQSPFIGHVASGYISIGAAAEYAVGNVLSDVENDYAWTRLEQVRYELERIQDRLHKPEVSGDMDAELAKLLAEETV